MSLITETLKSGFADRTESAPSAPNQPVSKGPAQRAVSGRSDWGISFAVTQDLRVPPAPTLTPTGPLASPELSLMAPAAVSVRLRLLWVSGTLRGVPCRLLPSP